MHQQCQTKRSLSNAQKEKKKKKKIHYSVNVLFNPSSDREQEISIHPLSVFRSVNCILYIFINSGWFIIQMIWTLCTLAFPPLQTRSLGFSVSVETWLKGTEVLKCIKMSSGQVILMRVKTVPMIFKLHEVDTSHWISMCIWLVIHYPLVDKDRTTY